MSVEAQTEPLGGSIEREKEEANCRQYDKLGLWKIDKESVLCQT